ncbi:hypothetical protein ONS95_011409 [Cadophora gregata]|uniref:uncharacterized protein n=1 Tax=Cadophora gregata TaxID=51156 RepID=UPI0026DBD5C3|nr:uncharacterized protein ONS95_011409 [Cadophora gregata]KAK0119988.1 hypothetical protein ONS95_011409 [Cadophora gregata]KAK0121024.1 hypothetical protein ONS96_011212 [Cadophora gregata f. sp. sojae]
MSSPNSTNSTKKKVHYERGTKGASHHHRSSRDSGVGSSSASDRASLGTTPNNNTSFSNAQIETQRHSLRAVQEALDAANDRIKRYEASTQKLDAALTESNKENRLLKKEKAELCNKVEDLLDALDDERERNARLRREVQGQVSSSSSSRNSPPRSSPRSSPRNSREIEEAATVSFHRESGRRSSYQQPQPMYPAAPQPPPNSAPNPFLPSPRNSSSGVPGVVFVPERTVNYAPSTLSYSSSPVYAHAPLTVQTRGSRYESGSVSGKGSSVNDGKYHLSPL